ncbi:hypothetical protein GIB67_025990 [Kingdonia uniflora]|uniref:C2 domain-containing protein n=1 Tax=Kingdonia uniflora TaxID=39325 RepID=A0A7J7M2X4_9MAGN|nr:hypothetical protein GIB67_025990 [Kingdonia uniflora]
MSTSQDLSPLNCELRIIRARNLDFISRGKLFVRYYLQSGNNKRVRLSTREIPSTSEPYWNESISLECFGGKEALDKLKHQSVVFELRWRNAKPTIFGTVSKSKLLVSAEMAWKEVLESSELSVEKWVTTKVWPSRSILEGLKPPAVQIGMKVSVPGTLLELPKRRKDVSLTHWNKCGCKNGECNGRDEDIFALAAVLVLV